jgi:myosin heavy chain 6/7
MLEPDAGKYFYVNQGMLTIDKVDDAQEMRDTKKAFDTLMFTQVIFIFIFIQN